MAARKLYRISHLMPFLMSDSLSGWDVYTRISNNPSRQKLIEVDSGNSAIRENGGR